MGEGCLSCGHTGCTSPLIRCCQHAHFRVTRCLVCPAAPVSASPSPALERRQFYLPSRPSPACGVLREGLEGGQSLSCPCGGGLSSLSLCQQNKTRELRGLLGPRKGLGGAPHTEMGVGEELAAPEPTGPPCAAALYMRWNPRGMGPGFPAGLH